MNLFHFYCKTKVRENDLQRKTKNITFIPITVITATSSNPTKEDNSGFYRVIDAFYGMDLYAKDNMHNLDRRKTEEVRQTILFLN